jgi:hypothetical protein
MPVMRSTAAAIECSLPRSSRTGMAMPPADSIVMTVLAAPDSLT